MSELSRGPELMEKIVSLCKRRGFVYPSSEIYGGFAAVYDYGHLGVELANNVKEAWWKAIVRHRDDIVGLDSAIFTSPRVWEASGHVGGFSDPLAECKSCHSRLRVDHLLEDVGVMADEKMSEEEINALLSEHMKEIKCPKCGKSDFSPAKKFNLLVKSNLGNFTGDWEKEPVYLRGETCQGIYVNFANVLNASRKRLPFGIAQIGKAFRNEITARQFIFRTREFEQMEMQYFTPPDQEMVEYEKLRAIRWQYYLDLGLKEENLKWHKHENLVFYAKEAYDIEYNFPFGFKELEGVHARGNYDLTQHSKFSGQELLYTDPVTNEKYLPHIIECSVGVGRTVLAVITDAYHEEMVDDEIRVVLRFPYKLAPVKVAILPLSKKEELSVPAKEVAQMLREADLMVEYDETQSIGKRYRRQDEIGTPLCVTFDFDSLEDKAVTIRDRDTMEQVRVPISELAAEIKKRLA
jgi:glycyl-tRNA synthetase